MDKDKPQDFGELLDSILEKGKLVEVRKKGAQYFIHLVYSELRKIMYLRSYADHMKYSELPPTKAKKDLDEIIKTLCFIMDVEESSFLDAADKYLTDMDVIIPDYEKIKDSVDFSDISSIEMLITDFDPYKKIKESNNNPQEVIEGARKIMAAAGKYLIQEEYKKDPEFKRYVIDELLSTVDVIGSDSYLKYRAVKKLKNLFGNTDFEQDGN